MGLLLAQVPEVAQRLNSIHPTMIITPLL
jgi:hypothetical protein